MTYSSVPVPGLSVVFLLLPWPSGRSSFRHGIARGVRLPGGAPRPRLGLPAAGAPRGKIAHQIKKTEVNTSWVCNHHRPGFSALAPAPSFVLS